MFIVFAAVIGALLLVVPQGNVFFEMMRMGGRCY